MADPPSRTHQALAPEGDASPAGRRPAVHGVPRASLDRVTVTDGVRSRPTYAVNLELFEGPLDLLLHLVRRHELDILDIPVAFITEKYVEYLDFARALDLEIAGEYLVMAATLVHLKSRELLPRSDETEDDTGTDELGEEDPRAELLKRLLEYERFRQAGRELEQRPINGRDVFPRGGDVDVAALDPGLASLTLFRLAEAYHRVLERARIKKSHEVVLETVTVRERMRELGLRLSAEDAVDFEGLFLDREWSSEAELRQMLVVTLMALLEMVKLGVVAIHQASGSETIVLRRLGEVNVARRLIDDFRDEDNEGGEEDEKDEKDEEDEEDEENEENEENEEGEGDEEDEAAGGSGRREEGERVESGRGHYPSDADTLDERDVRGSDDSGKAESDGS
ncbi:MAG: segregation/condensation protein A [Nannocystaceae bacterium]